MPGYDSSPTVYRIHGVSLVMPSEDLASRPTKAPQPLTPTAFSNADLPAAQRFEAWREQILPVAEIAPLEDGSSDGPVSFATWDLGAFAFFQEENPGARFARTRRRVRTAPADHWYVFLPRSGSNWTVSDGGGAAGRISRGAPGQPGFYSLASACHGAMAPMRTSALFVPRDLFAAEAGLLDRLDNTILSSPLGGLLADYLTVLERHLPAMTTARVPEIADATRAMLLACLIPERDRLQEAAHGLSIGLRERARAVVRERLGDPTLGPGEIARALGLSRSALYRLFEPQGGVARYIRQQRLSAARQALCDPADTRRIGTIGYDCGFPNPQEFSRAFKAQFGCSPSEARHERLSAPAGARALDAFLRSS